MNVIADRLFALLLGWTKALFNGLWNLLGNRDGGFIGFLQTFWLPIILILMAAGVVIDYVVWLIRWRPYFVWRTWLKNLGDRRRERLTRDYMEDLDRSPLDLPGYTAPVAYPDSLADGDAPVSFDFAPPADYAPPQDGLDDALYAQEPGPDSAYMPQIGEEAAWAQPPERFGPDDAWDPLQAEPSWMALFNQARQRQADEAALAPAPGGWADAIPEEASLTPPETAPSRRRRSERQRRRPDRFHNIRDALFSRGSEEPVDSLPPPVNPGSAYRAPYIPQNYRYNSGEARRGEDAKGRE